MFYPGIRTRITLPYLIAIAITAAIGVFVVTQLVAGSVQERFNNQLADSAQAASNTVADIERQQLSTLRAMVFTEGIAAAIDEGNADEINRLLRPIAVNQRADDVIVFNREGDALYHLQRIEAGGEFEYQRLEPPDLSVREGVQRILTRETDVLGDKFVDIIETDDVTFLYLNAPVINQDNELIGGISLGITAEHFAIRVGEQSLSAVTLYREDGTVIGSTFRAVDPALLVIKPDDLPLLLEEAEIGSPIRITEIQGTSYQTLYAPLRIRSQPIGLLGVSLSSNFIVERISTSRNYIALLFGLLFGIIALIGMGTARTIVRPITQLVDTTRAIREGDLSRRVELKTPDELGELGVSFDHMTDQLVLRNREMLAILVSISDAVIVQGVNGNTLLQNRAATKLEPIIPPEFLYNPEQLAEPRTLALANQFFSALSTPVRMDDNTLLGHVLVFRDITALIEAEQLKDEMMKQLSHELRTPLSAARGYLDLGIMFGQGTLNDSSQTYLTKSVDSLTTLERMINQVIDVSAMLSGQLVLDIEKFDLQALLRQQVEIWTPLCQQRDLSLTFTDTAEPVELSGDKQRLGQVLDHLLRNAYSYTLPGGKIDLTLKQENDVAIVTVKDTGVGIAEHELARIFERLYRGQSADAGPTDTRGLGLGLYFSKRIVEAHHGTIDLQSLMDVGTTVTLQLPTSVEG